MKPTLFDFSGSSVRVIHNESGARFVASDVCRILEISNPSDTVNKGLEEDERGVDIIYTPSGDQKMVTVTESGLYALIFKSRKPQAVQFRKWVTSEVLPAIRRTGQFSVVPAPAPPAFPVPATMAEALRLAADTIEERDAARAELAEAQPKIEFHDTVTATDKEVTMAVACQTAKLPFGSTTCYKKLRTMGVLISGGSRHNLPMQRYIEQGLFTVNEHKFERSNGEPDVSFTTHVTQKGIAWMISKFGKEVA